MIASSPIPFLYLHIPKTGGTSLEVALTRIVTGRAQESLSGRLLNDLALPGSDQLQHQKLSWFERHRDVGGRFVFTVVRNPFDRAVSQVMYLQRGNPGARYFRYRLWSDNLLALADAEMTMCGQDLSACQADYLTSRFGEIRCDYIARFERLESDWDYVCLKMGIDPVVKLPWVFNSNRIQPFQEFYNDKAREAIEEKYKMDLDTFGYSFD